MFLIYQIFLFLILLISPIIIIFRILKNKEDKIRFKEKFCFFSKKRGVGNVIWFHGSSVGEILSIIPIIKKYEKDRSIQKILITSSTLSSSKVLRKFNFKKTIHQFYPIDLYFFSNLFLNYWRPQVAIFLESEIWPSMFLTLNKKKIPLILLNARITKKTFRKWKKVNLVSESIFDKIKIAYPQNIETKYFLKKLEVKNIKSIGNLKFIDAEHKSKNKLDKKITQKLKKFKIWVAASTHQNEEIFAANAHILLKKKNKKILTIMIPRHIDRVNHIISEIQKLNLKVIKHTSKNKSFDDVDIYMVDSFGESEKFYKLASTVFMGGSLTNKGGQNPLEAARFGAKTLHGPYIENFKEIYKLLKVYKLSNMVKTSKKLASSIKFKKNTEKGIQIKNFGRIIFKRTIKELDKIIYNEVKKTKFLGL